MQGTKKSQNNREKEQSCSTYTSWLQSLLQNYSNQDSVVSGTGQRNRVQKSILIFTVNSFYVLKCFYYLEKGDWTYIDYVLIHLSNSGTVQLYLFKLW